MFGLLPSRFFILALAFSLPTASATSQLPSRSWCEAPFRSTADRAIAAPSFAGGPGLIEVPSATTFAEGDLTLAFNQAQGRDRPAGTAWQNNGLLSVSFLPRLTLTGRATVREVNGDVDKRDLSANAHLLLLEERGWRPALAVGGNDLSGGAQNYVATYGVLTKSVTNRARVTLGYGRGQRSLDGPFGGIEFAPCDWITLLAEQSGWRHGSGVRLRPFPSAGERTGLHLTLDAVRIDGQGWTGGVGLRWNAGPARAHRSLPAYPQDVPTFPVAPARRTIDGMAADLVTELTFAGLENLRVTPIDSATLRVDYENRRWTLDDVDAIGTVLGIVAARVPPRIQHVALVVRTADLPILSIATDLAPFRAYLDDPSMERAFVDQLHVALPSVPPAGLRMQAINPSRFRVDLSVRPRLEQISMFELSALETRGGLLPEVEVQLAPGVVLAGRRNIPLWVTDQFIPLEDAGADRLLLHIARRMSDRWAPAGGATIGQLSLGRIGQRQVGAVWEQEMTRADGRWSVGVTGALFGSSFASVDRSYAFGTLRWRHPERELRTAISVGQFQYGDVGVLADVVRRFGLVDVGFRLRSTDLTSQAGLLLNIPIGPRRQLHPGPVRLAAPDYLDFAYQTVVFQSTNPIRADVARSLETGHEIWRAYGGRDWLRPESVRARPWAIRNGALRTP